MSPRLSLAHASFGIWLIRMGRKLADRGFAIVELELARWREVEGYMTEAEETELDAELLDKPVSSSRAA